MHSHNFNQPKRTIKSRWYYYCAKHCATFGQQLGQQEAKTCERDGRLVKSVQMDNVPVSIRPLFPSKSTVLRFTRFPSSEGTGPVSWLVLRYKLCKLLRNPNCVGIVPFNALLLKSKLFKFLRYTICVGIVPVSLQPYNCKSVKVVR